MLDGFGGNLDETWLDNSSTLETPVSRCCVLNQATLTGDRIAEYHEANHTLTVIRRQ